MHFMFLILAFLLCAVVWGFFHANPRGVGSLSLLACNIAILALGAAFAAAAAIPLYADWTTACSSSVTTGSSRRSRLADRTSSAKTPSRRISSA